MNRRVVAFAILGTGFLIVAAEEVLGMFHGGDMCWLGNGEPFNGQPCPKNFVADPLRMLFANLWILLTDFTANAPWGFPLFFAMMLATFMVSMTFFYLSLHELDQKGVEGRRREESSTQGERP